jgi:hypothetical protein
MAFMLSPSRFTPAADVSLLISYLSHGPQQIYLSQAVVGNVWPTAHSNSPLLGNIFTFVFMYERKFVLDTHLTQDILKEMCCLLHTAGMYFLRTGV